MLVRQWFRNIILHLACLVAALPSISVWAQTSQPEPEARTGPLRFSVTYDSAVTDSYTGRVYVIVSTSNFQPRYTINTFNYDPLFAQDVKDWKPDTPLVFDDTCLAFPVALGELPAGQYMVQAMLRRNPDSPLISNSSGNASSDYPKLDLSGTDGGTVELHIDHVIEQFPYRDREYLKFVEMRSELLSEFHGREVIMRAGVHLPPWFENETDRKYPALYWIDGFGSDHSRVHMMSRMSAEIGSHSRLMRIGLDTQCFSGHHAYADSENNGPYARALIEEFIPFLDEKFRLVPAPTARFLGGHSSGAWSALWLQVQYPESFGGVWSFAPDSVDFRDFQRINLYEPNANVYVDSQGNRRPIIVDGEIVRVWFRDYARKEVVYGDGMQIGSFEWVFSPKGSDGRPQQLFDRTSGNVNASVADAWKRYDVSLILRENWESLAPGLDGKIHVHVGEKDMHMLDGAVKLLKEELEKAGADAVVEVHPHDDHITVIHAGQWRPMEEKIMATFEKHHGKKGTGVAKPQ